MSVEVTNGFVALMPLYYNKFSVTLWKKKLCVRKVQAVALPLASMSDVMKENSHGTERRNI